MYRPFHHILLLVSYLSISALAQSSDAAAKKKNPTIEPAFTANLTLAAGPPYIPIEGGLRIIRPITGGTLKGPSLNAKVAGGFAADGFYDNGNDQKPTVYVYGTADDGSGFYIRETGVGNLASWLTRLEIEIGGKYAALSNEYIVANNAADKTGSQIVVPVYKVTGSGCC